MNNKKIVKNKVLKIFILAVVILGATSGIVLIGHKKQVYNVFSIITGVSDVSVFERRLVKNIAKNNYVMFSGKVENEISTSSSELSTSQYNVTVGVVMKNDGNLKYGEKILINDLPGKIPDRYFRDYVALYDRANNVYDTASFQTFIHKFNATILKKLGTERVYGEKTFKYEVSVTYSSSISRKLNGTVVVYSLNPDLVLEENEEASFETIELSDGKHIILMAGDSVIYD